MDFSPPDARDDRPLSAQAMPAPPAGAAYLDGLNPEQRAAVETLDGPLLVLAGAGTGKTRALTSRIAHLMATRRARPWEILAVTFTNKAAREMRHRVAAHVGDAAESLRWLGTFHSISAQMLRRHAELVGLRPDFTILDDDDRLRLLKQQIEAANIDVKRWTPRYLGSLIDGWKNRGLVPSQVPQDEAWAFAEGRGGKLYEEYQERLRILNAADFGDLLLHVLTILKGHEDVLAGWRERFRYVLVDEYQDSNTAQYLWLRLLAHPRANICCVGDDDQSIYAWRGAEVENILRFEKDFPGAKVIRLERNYRSTPHILGAASGLIAANKDRLGKTLRPEAADQGDKIRLQGVWDGEEEARTVADEVEAWRRAGGRHDQCAVLVRASFQMRAFEERFISLAIPYRVVGGPRFFEREEIRDANAYLRLIHSTDDDLAFDRIVNKPRRGIGDKTLQTVRLAAREQQVSMVAAAHSLLGSDELPTRARSQISAFLGLLDRWRDEAHRMSHVDLAQMVLDDSGYTDMWRKDSSPNAASKLENLKELIQALGEFDSLAAFLDHVALVMDRADDAAEDKVWLMTLHAAKGLEFDSVFLPGWEEGVFPSQRSLDEGGERALEEERRLAYVGLTRARKRAHILFAANRQIYGRWQPSLPSRFIDELPKDDVDVIARPSLYGAPAPEQGFAAVEVMAEGAARYAGPGWKRAQAAAERRTAGATRAPIEGQAVRLDQECAVRFRVGDPVTHAKFGRGLIVQ